MSSMSQGVIGLYESPVFREFGVMSSANGNAFNLLELPTFTHQL